MVQFVIPSKSLSIKMLNSVAKSFAVLLLVMMFRPADAFAWNCRECREHCGFGPYAKYCMDTCFCNDQLGISERKESRPVFGAIAYSIPDASWGHAYNARTRIDATNIAVKYCRENSKAPQQCRAVTWFVNSCGALATDEKGHPWSVGGGNDSPNYSLSQATSAALSLCRRNGGKNCSITTAVCSDGTTPEIEKENAERAKVLLGGLATATCALFQSCASAATGTRVAQQFVAICIPNVVDAEGSFLPAARAAIDNGAMAAHFAKIETIIAQLKSKPDSPLRSALANGNGHARLTLSTYDNPQKTVTVAPLSSDKALTCPAGYSRNRYVASEWLAQTGLNPRGLKSY